MTDIFTILRRTARQLGEPTGALDRPSLEGHNGCIGSAPRGDACGTGSICPSSD